MKIISKQNDFSLTHPKHPECEQGTTVPQKAQISHKKQLRGGTPSDSPSDYSAKQAEVKTHSQKARETSNDPMFHNLINWAIPQTIEK